MRDVPEERVTAAFGIPAVVVGLGVGLAHSSDKHNIETANEMAWKNCVIPIKTQMAAQIGDQLRGDVLGYLDGDLVGWDYTQVAALQQDESERHKIIRDDWTSGMILRSEARQKHGLPVDDAKDDVYYTDLTAPDLAPGGVQADKE